MPVAQFNLGYLKYARDAPEMSSYIEQLDKVMKIAVSNPGLIWLHEDNTINEVITRLGLALLLLSGSLFIYLPALLLAILVVIIHITFAKRTTTAEP